MSCLPSLSLPPFPQIPGLPGLPSFSLPPINFNLDFEFGLPTLSLPPFPEIPGLPNINISFTLPNLPPLELPCPLE